MTATYMHLEKHSISKFSLTCGLGIVYWELNLANVSKPADLMTDWDFCCIIFCWIVSSWVVNLHLASKSACVSIPFYSNSKPNNTTNCYIYSFLAALSSSYGKQNQGKLGKPLVFPFKSKINLIIHDLEGMFFITKCNITKRHKASFFCLNKVVFHQLFFSDSECSFIPVMKDFIKWSKMTDRLWFIDKQPRLG